VRRRSREIDIFSMSFLDCICCGFGAVILLLVLVDVGDPAAIEKSRTELQDRIVAKQQELVEIRDEAAELNRDLPSEIRKLEREKARLSRLAGDLTNIRGQYSASEKDAAVANIVEGELVAAQQTLTKEMERLLKLRAARPRPASGAIGGIPIDSEYIIFIIDTSASMQRSHWNEAIDVMREILDIYPQVKGMQVMDDEGKVMLGNTRGQWLNDSPAQRQQILTRMKAWNAFSNSSPVEGISEAIRTYWAADKRISLYVLGDEFTGDSIQAALDSVGRVNKADQSGRRLVRIHAVGFPAGPEMAPFTNVRFSALMRLMCEQNNGTFVGITH